MSQKIVDLAIQEGGGEQIKSSLISFEFRGNEYEAWRFKGNYILNRLSKKEEQFVCDEIANGQFTRYIDANAVQLPDSINSKYRQSVNSVHYFSLLPFGLNDAAVNKKWLGEEKIKGKAYHKVQISFKKEGGGDDFDDVFLYWINKESNEVAYLAYEYQTNNGGIRFREAFNKRSIKGIKFADYNNYKPKNKEVKLVDIAKEFDSGNLELLSKIILENIEVINIDETCASC